MGCMACSYSTLYSGLLAEGLLLAIAAADDMTFPQLHTRAHTGPFHLTA